MDFKELKKYTKNLSILYVEDDRELREQMSEVLENLFAHVAIAADGREALELFKQNREKATDNYALVVTDVQMPKCNGLELSKKILALNATQKIIIVSAHDEMDVMAHMEAIGVTNLILKPLQYDEMMNTFYDVIVNAS